jgi:polysaccharide biosynthesis/export protein
MGIESAMKNRTSAILGWVPAALVLYGCGTDVPHLPPAPPIPPASLAYRVQPGDMLDVKFLYNPELNEQPTVQPDGRISMLFAHSLQVGGLTTDQIRHALTDAYARELQKPGISVAIKGAVPWKIYVGGEVNRPDEFNNVGPTPTLTQIITRAGGIKDSGDATKIVLLRRIDGKPIGYIMNFAEVAKGKQPNHDVKLASYDAIYVPRTGVADVYKAYNQYFKQFLPDNVGVAYRVQ